MRIKPTTIHAKGLILISVPLLVELAFAITMLAMLNFYEAELNQERAAVEINFHANEMLIEFTELIAARGYYAFFGGEMPTVEERIERVRNEHDLLKNLVANEAQQAQTVETMWANLSYSIELSERLIPIWPKQLKGSEKMSLLNANLDTLARIDRYISEVGNQLRNFQVGEILNRDLLNADSTSASLLEDSVIVGSLCATTLLALLLFARFVRSINRGVGLVIENTQRFRQGLELTPPAEKGDELAQVDAALYDMADEIKEARRTKQAIMSMISHDLRSPLASVNAFLTSFTSGIYGDVPAATLPEAQQCEREVEKLIQFITNLLDLDKIEAGQFELRRKSIPLDDVVRQSIAATRPRARDRNVTIEVAACDGELFADPDRIVQALTNVCSKAVQMSAPGSRIEITSGQHDGMTEVRVTSPSASPSPAELHSLFEPYVPGRPGLRLKLPISREIVKLHDGTMGADSTNEQSLTFWLRLPTALPIP